MVFKPTFHRYASKLVSHARDLRAAMTPAERKLWYDFLRTQKPRWLRQRPVADFILDFYCPVLKLAIEVDGETHMNTEAEEYDAKRTATLDGSGILVARFTNVEVLGDFENICVRIRVLIQKRSS